MIDNLTFKQWVTVDQSTLDPVSKLADEFVEFFCEKLQQLIPHSFIATQQASFFTECKSTLKPNELLVQADFSENYSFILQDSSQGFHLNNSQATVRPFVVYYKNLEEERHLSYVVTSDCLNHDTIAVYLFQRKLIFFLNPFPGEAEYIRLAIARYFKNT